MTAPSPSRGSSRCSTWSSGEVTPGGIGAGMYGMLVIGAILAVFIAGLMVGRTPEYLGKKVEAFEIKMAMLVALVLGASILGFTAIASVLPAGLAGPLNPGRARLQRDPVRLLEPDRQQRFGLRRPDRQHALLQHHRRPRDAHRPLRDDRPDPRPRRLDGCQAQPSPRRSGRSRPPGSCGSSCSSVSSSSSARSRSSRRSPWARSSSSSSRTPERSPDGSPVGRPRARHPPLPALRHPRRGEALRRATQAARRSSTRTSCGPPSRTPSASSIRGC